MSGPRRKSGRGALVILALILAASGALRLGAGVGAAMANSAEADTTSPLNCPVPPAAVAAALVGREAQVKEQELALAERMAALGIGGRGNCQAAGRTEGCRGGA